MCVYCGCLPSALFPFSGLVHFILVFKQAANQNNTFLPPTEVSIFPKLDYSSGYTNLLKRWARGEPNLGHSQALPRIFLNLIKVRKALSCPVANCKGELVRY